MKPQKAVGLKVTVYYDELDSGSYNWQLFDKATVYETHIKDLASLPMGLMFCSDLLLSCELVGCSLIV